MQSGDRVLIDVSSVKDEMYPALYDRLAARQANVCDVGAYMAVAVPDDISAVIHGDLGRRIIHIEKPAAQVVLHRYLACDGIDVTLADLDHPALHSKPMRAIDRLAQSIGDAKNKGVGDIRDWVESALKAASEHAKNVADRAAKMKGSERVLFLAAGVLNDAHADAVYDAARSLHEHVDLAGDDTPLLEQEGLIQQLDGFDVTVDDTSGCISFADFDYDAMIRTYFWSNYPGLRMQFRQWIGDVVSQSTLSGGDRDRVITRFAEQALRTGRPTDLTSLAEGWSAKGASAARWPDAVRVLQLGLEDPRHSSVIRRKIRQWAIQQDLPAERGQVLVEVCADVLARNDPMSAAIRLRHLARQADRRISDAAREAISTLCRQDRWFCREFMHLLITRMDSARVVSPADIEIFLHVTDPDECAAIVSSPGLRLLLTHGWHLAMTQSEHPTWRQNVQKWLGAVSDARLDEGTLDILLDAAARKDDALSRLYATTVRWRQGQVTHLRERMAVANHFCRQINELQGL
ncbi:hypothetical protein FAF44_05495 [Nonomuraea sp. MG754425]|uniref:hypothetical protein n=1 Tax=Nonomuraea sp. MG754425 TaxID=2570319 RepID=UPI001F3DECFA|nr:hypothetical protein [Nonomuraea sp. MG754425]MCF6467864.1 hypothetical protein [Nonomuraea sp. MG754425]